MVERINTADAIKFSTDVPIRDQLRTVAEREADLFSSEGFIGLSRVCFVELLSGSAFLLDIADQLGECERQFAHWIQEATDAGKPCFSQLEGKSKQGVYERQHFSYP